MAGLSWTRLPWVMNGMWQTILTCLSQTGTEVCTLNSITGGVLTWSVGILQKPGGYA